MRREHKRIIKIQRGNKTESAKAMENYIKDRFEEFKADSMVLYVQRKRNII